MKKLLGHISFEFRSIYKIIGWLAIGLIILQNIPLISKFSSFNRQVVAINGRKVPVRLELVLEESMYGLIFYIVFFLALSLCVFMLLKDLYPAKSLYSLLTLPTPRWLIYVSKVLGLILGLLTIIGAQYLSIFITSGLYKVLIARDYQMTNALFLAFSRDSFLEIFSPLHLSLFFFNLTSLIFLILGIFSITILGYLRENKWYLSIAQWLIISVILASLAFENSFYVFYLNIDSHINSILEVNKLKMILWSGIFILSTIHISVASLKSFTVYSGKRV